MRHRHLRLSLHVAAGPLFSTIASHPADRRPPSLRTGTQHPSWRTSEPVKRNRPEREGQQRAQPRRPLEHGPTPSRSRPPSTPGEDATRAAQRRRRRIRPGRGQGRAAQRNAGATRPGLVKQMSTPPADAPADWAASRATCTCRRPCLKSGNRRSPPLMSHDRPGPAARCGLAACAESVLQLASPGPAPCVCRVRLTSSCRAAAPTDFSSRIPVRPDAAHPH